jgi:hypothetical protein
MRKQFRELKNLCSELYIYGANITIKREGVVLTGKRGGTGYVQSTRYSMRGAPRFQPQIQQQGF